jgi:hypothetical protein
LIPVEIKFANNSPLCPDLSQTAPRHSHSIILSRGNALI